MFRKNAGLVWQFTPTDKESESLLSRLYRIAPSATSYQVYIRSYLYVCIRFADKWWQFSASTKSFFTYYIFIQREIATFYIFSLKFIILTATLRASWHWTCVWNTDFLPVRAWKGCLVSDRMIFLIPECVIWFF
jgi:hypothetical protein